MKQALVHLIYSPWLLSFLLCVCLPVFACPSLSLLTAPLNQLMRCLRKYQSRTPSPLLHSVPSEIVFDFEPGPVFRGSWALLSCSHPSKLNIRYRLCVCLTSQRVFVSVRVLSTKFLLGLAGMLWMCFSHPHYCKLPVCCLLQTFKSKKFLSWDFHLAHFCLSSAWSG